MRIFINKMAIKKRIYRAKTKPMISTKFPEMPSSGAN
jgi:hypothetical protein